ncbi:hypothetical protein J2X48_004774 [Bosea sp. BE271]|nr:hypothetical protein [Bosea robiniae]MDR6897336.1 hypothetical protein [Bosea sp. BE109]MDR7140733.1 hypothetical protein [Bosea sp. BE168]MDR7177825.1 hypothetical protein [Bosea sp. BE271]
MMTADFSVSMNGRALLHINHLSNSL